MAVCFGIVDTLDRLKRTAVDFEVPHRSGYRALYPCKGSPVDGHLGIGSSILDRISPNITVALAARSPREGSVFNRYGTLVINRACTFSKVPSSMVSTADSCVPDCRAAGIGAPR